MAPGRAPRPCGGDGTTEQLPRVVRTVGAMRIAITGSSGLIGTALRHHLTAGGHETVPVVRAEAGDGEIPWDPDRGRLDAGDLVGIDAVVHLAGANIGGRRWTDDYKRILLDSRVDSTGLLADRRAARGDAGPRTLISGSAIGFYGDRGDELVDESSASGDGFLADICRQWEDATGPAADAGVRVAHIRTGIVLTPKGGALAKMLPLFKLGAGGRFGSGEQWMSWISLTDELRAIEHLLTSTVSGPVNLTAPNPVRNREFADTLGDVLHRPTVLPVPKFGPKLLLGAELADALLFDGQRVRPTVLGHDGFEFSHPDLAAALRAELGR
jgi:uncharacterized protein (TIGR01777 family)